jgi:hypothetical protein
LISRNPVFGEGVMGPAYYILAVLGCGEGETACQQVAVADAQFTSIAACQSASEATLMRHSDADYPVVVAQCRKAGQQASVQILGSEVALPQPDAEAPLQPRRASFKGQRLARR